MEISRYLSTRVRLCDIVRTRISKRRRRRKWWWKNVRVMTVILIVMIKFTILVKKVKVFISKSNAIITLSK